MPTKAVAAETMEVGKKGRGKHWTADQVQARKEAAEALKRKEKIKLKPPAWLSRDALVIWNKKIKEASGVDLLDVLDEESLAVYCDLVIKYKGISNRSKLRVEDHKALQAYAARITQYAERLGFTPAARARLIKQKAGENEKDEFGDKYD